MIPLLKVISLGSGLSLQDGGRVGLRRFGVAPGGFLDRELATLANRLVGNVPDLPVLEISLQGAILEVLATCRFAVSGSDGLRQMLANSSQVFKAGDRLVFDRRSNVAYTYLAVEGGFHGKRVFGSVSVDSRAGIGEGIERGSIIVSNFNCMPDSDSRFGRRIACREIIPDRETQSPFRLLPGPHVNLFREDQLDTVSQVKWTVSNYKDRTGLRLEGAKTLANSISVNSFPVALGSMQITPAGQPIVTLNDGPTVGGYPVIGILKEKDRYRLSQSISGSPVQFQWA